MNVKKFNTNSSINLLFWLLTTDFKCDNQTLCDKGDSIILNLMVSKPFFLPTHISEQGKVIYVSVYIRECSLYVGLMDIVQKLI